MCAHTPVLPFSAQELFSQVSLPNSPGRGMVLKRHSSLPLRTSNARTTPLVLLWVGTVAPSRMEEPTITTSPVTVGAAWMPISPRSRSICSLFPFTTPTLMSRMPSLAKEGITAPVLALSSTRRKPVVT